MTPTPVAPTGIAAQAFCGAATVANLPTGYSWYAAATGGAALAASTALSTGSYFATTTTNGCESARSAAVSVTVTPTTAPTGIAAQAFCGAATVANLPTGYSWYAAATGGAALAASTALSTGSYFATTTTNGCESARSAAVSVTVTPTTAPTGIAAQAFCGAATVANLPTGYSWYAAATGGAALAASTALSTGSYFATTTTNGCESARSAAVSVTINTLPVVTVPNNIAVNTATGQCVASPLNFAATATGFPTPTIVYSVGADDINPASYAFPVGTTTVTVKATNSCGVDTKTFTVKVTDNVKPVITAAANVTTTTNTGCTATGVILGNTTATDNCTVGMPVGVRSDGLALSAAYPVGTTTIAWNVTDANGNAAEQVSQTVKVTDNINPVIVANGNKEVNVDAAKCSAAVTVSATATDNCTVGTPVGVRSDGLALSAAYPVGTTTIAWNVTDANGNAAEQVSQTVKVTDNINPVIVANGNKEVNVDAAKCSAAVTVSATATDNCTVGTPVGVRSDGLALSAAYPVGTTTIAWNVTDANGNAAEQVSQTVKVTNAAPVITSVTAPIDPTRLGTSITLAVNYVDNNVTKAIIKWGDGTPEQQVANPATIFYTDHTYAAAGVYTVTVTATDACGQTSLAFVYQYVVVYDPAGGFVTGGGWITSLPGAYVANPSATGKASFGFVSKYQKGATVPTGNTNFEFKAVGMNFSSTSYEWLVISGAKAQYKGEGTINGSGAYGFLLTALDGQVTGGGGLDKFRIKIWNKASGNTVYDNNMGSVEGSADDAQPSTELGGGSIVIHTPNKGNTANAVARDEATVNSDDSNLLEVYPNPLAKQGTIHFRSQKGGKAQVYLYNQVGALVATLYNAEVEGGREYYVTLSSENIADGVYFCRMITNGKVENKRITIMR
ncbi:T9SS type A sorting domain-containing protein [Hymenobacter sp. B1770]|uniref:Ig-like domain-containing protein n=1 Tax=Hymenobacter sp. B1770 TaxID=1718788 RepID=UPI003CF7ACCA